MAVFPSVLRNGATLCAIAAAALIPMAAMAQTPAKPAAPGAPAAGVAVPQIRFTVLSDGTGVSPTDEDVVLLSYFGKLADGTVFDENGQTAFAISDVVPGFAQGLKRMKKGGAYKVEIPPELGYGAEASGPIPANATLTFIVMLFDFKSKAEIAAIQAQQGAGDAGAAPPAPTQPN